ncbi:MAG: PD-(D/E)XK nuclease family protein [Kiritimatiellae bacterium]|nr:PD-(D/E)XK nuclease family protein [Kiritimatiellia bacterium]
MKETLSASRMAAFLACPRKHYYQYELGLEREESAPALRFGSAMHRALEARANGEGLLESYEAAKDGQQLTDPIELAKLYGLLGGYFHLYGRADGEKEAIAKMHPECQWTLPIPSSRTFQHVGVIDGLAVLKDGRTAIVEHKTTGEDISDTSDYWTRLQFNGQLFLYVLAARANGWDVDTVIYDVIRKPAIRQKQNETAEEYGDRLVADAMERPEFYYARREVAILDSAIAEFEIQRDVICKMLLHCKAAARKAALPEHGWARNCNGLTCRNCEYAGFCMQCVHVDAQHLPVGFKLKSSSVAATVAATTDQNQTNTKEQ